MALRGLFVVALALSTAVAFRPLSGGRLAGRPAGLRMVQQEDEPVLNKKAERRRIMKSENFHRGHVEQRPEAEELMGEYKSDLVETLRNQDYVLQRDGITVHLAQQFGFCWGVERAIQIAYEARLKYSDKKIFLTNEIIHNPEVNEKLEGMGIEVIPKDDQGNKDLSVVGDADVVILPAFGATLQEMQTLDSRGVVMTDSTCPWVSKVWNSVDKMRNVDATAIIHGKKNHEETVATASHSDDYIIVKDMKEAQIVVDYILNGGDDAEFLSKFQGATSEGFSPKKHLKKLGLANQTTMYKRETRAIGKLLETTMMKKYGPENVANHYVEYDTICDATQERQDAITDLMEARASELDVLLVVGGFDSSNTAHLVEIGEKYGVTTYHVDRASRISADNSIEHRLHDGQVVTARDWMPAGDVTLAITAGASTADRYVEECLESVFMLKAALRSKEGAAERADGA